MATQASRTDGGRLSVRAFAKRVPVAHRAVQDGIASGRLDKSIGRDEKGRPFIADEDLALQEWTENAARPAKGGGGAQETLSEAQRQVALERAKSLRLSNRQKSGQLIRVEVAQRQGFECARTIRDSILNVPDRVAGELGLDARKRARLEEELHRALAAAAEILSRERDE
jgi:phage terminase Nu1 subunit (DNA packaging protein)